MPPGEGTVMSQPITSPESSKILRASLWVAIGALIAAALVCVVWVLIGDDTAAIGGLVDAVAARHRETMRVRIERMDEARATVREALRAEPFDRAALDDAFAGLREADSRTAAEAHALISEVAAEANPSERERLSRLMEGRRRRGNHHPPPH